MMNAWRPTLSPLRDFTLQLPTKVAGSSLQIPDLILAVMSAAKNPFQAAWSLAGKFSGLINGITQNMSGGVVQVPYGFAGTMAYDEVDLSEYVQSAGNVLKSMIYTTYGQNDDEFVNKSTQYGSAIGADGVKKLALGGTDLMKDIKEGTTLVDRASKEWDVSPLDVVAQAQRGPLSSFVSKNGMGMIWVGNSSDTKRIEAVAAGRLIPFMGEQRSNVSRKIIIANVNSVGLNAARSLNLVSSLVLGKLTGNPLAPPQYK
jgi:hypothetical protein